MSKHALLIHAHPEPRSFVTAMRDTIAGELERAGTVVAHSDLYAMGYNPVLSRADFPVDQGEDPLVIALAQRRGYADGTLAPDIMLEIEKVRAADLLVFTFPIFWFSTPAILKGWIDRTFVSGPFYGGRRIYSEGGLKGKRAFVALSLGGRGHMFGDGSLHGPLQQGMLRHFLQGTLGYVATRDGRTDRFDDTSHLDTRRKRTFVPNLVLVIYHKRVGEIETRSHHPDQHLPATWHGFVHVFKNKSARRAGRVTGNLSHMNPSN